MSWIRTDAYVIPDPNTDRSNTISRDVSVRETLISELHSVEIISPGGSLVTQPYDKISPAMRERYLAASPYNPVRVILGERFASDSERDNVYTRATAHLNEWTSAGVLEREAAPCLYAYFQQFTVPDTGERASSAWRRWANTRKAWCTLTAIFYTAVTFAHR